MKILMSENLNIKIFCQTSCFLIQIIDFQVHTTYETMANDNSNSIYDVSLETSKDEDNIVFLTLCLK